MSSKIIISAIFLVVVAGQVYSTSASEIEVLQQNCRDTIVQCQTSLLGVTGVNFILATLMASLLIVVILPVLLTLVVSVCAATTIIIATNLILTVLATLIQLVGFAVTLLLRNCDAGEFNHNISTAEDDCRNQLISIAQGNNIVVDLCLVALGKILVIIKLALTGFIIL